MESPQAKGKMDLYTRLIDSSMVTTVSIDNSKELSSDERHLYMSQLVGLHKTCLREFAHYTCCVLFSVLYQIFAAWFPHKYYFFRYERCLHLSECPYQYIEDGQHRWTFVCVEKIRPTADYEVVYGCPDEEATKASVLQLPVEQRMIVFRNRRYLYNETTDMFELLHCPATVDGKVLQSRMRGVGMTNEEALTVARAYGRNVFAIPLPTIFDLLMRECLHPFFIFQVYSVILWCFEEYFVFASVIAVMALLAVGNNINETRRNIRRLQTLGRDTSTLRVIREGREFNQSSMDAVLGDLVVLEAGMIVPCDLTILSGSAVLNESMLTGESVPVVKYPPPDTMKEKVAIGSDNRSTLFGGTCILQLQTTQNERVYALVAKTGFFTNKGNMISSMLYPPKSTFSFETQAYKYQLFFFALAIVGMSVAFWKYSEEGAPVSLMFLRALDQVTIVVPPSLPLAVSVGVAYSVACLVKKKIFCIEPARVTYAGKIQTMCFDKTGTLTDDSLKYGGVHSFVPLNEIVPVSYLMHAEHHNGLVPSPKATHSQLTLEEALLPIAVRACLSTCHSLALHNKEFIGDSLEIEGFNSANAKFIESETSGVLFRSQQQCFTGIQQDDLMLSNTHSEDSSENSNPMEENTPQISRFPDNTTLAVCPPNVRVEMQNLQQCQCDCHFYAHHVRTCSCQANPTFACLLHTSGNTKLQVPEKCPTFQMGMNGRHWAVLKQYPFESGLQRMSVLALNEADQTVHVFAKGAPEKLASLCDPSTIPSDYQRVVEWYTRQGNRVIALATKQFRVPSNTSSIEEEQKSNGDIGSSVEEINHYTSNTDPELVRLEVESNMQMLGLLILENSLKPATTHTIDKLQHAQIRTIMVTGDNVRTAVAVAKDCNIIHNDTAVFVSEIVPNHNPHTPLTIDNIRWVYTDNSDITLDNKFFDVQAVDGTTLDFTKFELAVTGDAFKLLQQDHEACIQNATQQQEEGIELDRIPSKEDRVKLSRSAGMSDPNASTMNSRSFEFPHMRDVQIASMLQRVIVSGAVYARFSPDQKAALVVHYIKLGMYTGMCGDGANDCGALKAAHAGISLAESEASIAAPFTSQIQDISCVPIVLLEGRSALATTFLLFRYMSLYSFIQYCSVSLLYFKSASYCDWQFLYQDLFAVFPLAVAMGYTNAGHKLTNRRPSADLLSFENMLGINLHMLVCGAFQFALYYLGNQRQSGEVEPDNEDHTCNIHQATFLQYFTCMQYVLLAIVISTMPPWKKPFFTNPILVTILLCSFGITIYAFLSTPNHFVLMFFTRDDFPVETYLKYITLALFAGHILMTCFVEFAFVPFIMQCKRNGMKKFYTNTVFGNGNSQVHKGAKPYHLLRRHFEDAWPEQKKNIHIQYQ